MASGGGSGAATPRGSQIEAFSVHDVVTDKGLQCLEAWEGYALLGLAGEPRGRRAESAHLRPAK